MLLEPAEGLPNLGCFMTVFPGSTEVSQGDGHCFIHYLHPRHPKQCLTHESCSLVVANQRTR